MLVYDNDIDDEDDLFPFARIFQVCVQRFCQQRGGNSERERNSHPGWNFQQLNPLVQLTHQ
jgi:hypothetical protein